LARNSEKLPVLIIQHPREKDMLRRLANQALLPILAFYLYLAGSAPYLGQWDSFDYLKQIVTHQFSALGIGRPVFVGYNIVLWESMRKILGLVPLQVETVVMLGIVLFGVSGVLLFQRLSRELLSSPACQMAAVALVVSPVYAIYSGYIMTEVPMLAVLMASALLIWKSGDRSRPWQDIAGGILFGLAVGIREQALTLSAAFLWILWSRRSGAACRFRSMLRFGVAAGIIILAPVFVFYFYDPTAFAGRIQTWFRAIPLGSSQFRNNMEFSLLYAFILCPGAWLATAGAGVYRLFTKRRSRLSVNSPEINSIPNPIWGLLCCLVLPMLVLWRDADVQPRYLLILLPASLIFCASLFHRWIPSRRGLVIWGVVQVLFLGLALTAFWPYRQTQIEKMEFARSMRESIPDAGLIIAGNYSPILDYYRGIGERPQWQIVWSGWDWDVKALDANIHEAWDNNLPVYLSTDPKGWSNFETEFLDVHILLKDRKKQQIVKNLYRVYP
jgi:hypothetical protein